MNDPHFAALTSALAGRFILERPLAADREALVFLARDLRLERPVVVTALPPGHDAAAREAFRARATVAARLAHPNIVPVHEVRETGDLVWYVSSFVQGRSLASRVKTEGPVPPSLVAEMGRQIAWALAYAHEQELVHGALAPTSVFLEDGTGRAMITGFGAIPSSVVTDPAVDLAGLHRTIVFALRGAASLDPDEAAAATALLPEWAAGPLRTLGSPGSTDLPSTAQQVAEALTPPIRPEMPPVLRDWLAARNPLRIVLMSWSFVQTTLWLLNSGGTVDTYILDTWSPWVLAWPVAILQLRRVLKAGFGPPEVLGVLDQRLAIRREEMGDRRPKRGAKMATWALLVILLGAGVTMIDPVRLAHVPLAHFLLILIGVLLVATAYRAWRSRSRPERPRDELMEQRVALWHGPLGRLTFRLAGLGLRHRAVESAGFDQRPTTVILADSIRELARSLPKELLRQFPGVGASVDHLERAAGVLRARVQRLEGAAVPPVDPILSESLRAARARHADAVVALETMRLALLAARGAVADIGAATAELEDAMALAERMVHIAAGKDEIAREVPG